MNTTTRNDVAKIDRASTIPWGEGESFIQAYWACNNCSSENFTIVDPDTRSTRYYGQKMFEDNCTHCHHHFYVPASEVAKL
tara:strand:- start:815 stop:1057 length:243 start_codon:yes stop_codon:yes gene_type:complete